MTARTWTDQPLVCEACNIVASVPTSRGRIEVRALPQSSAYYVTCGSLFGSQTVFCRDVVAMGKVLTAASNTPKGTIEMPAGCHLVEDGKPPKTVSFDTETKEA